MKKRILIIDDERDLTKAVKAWLEGAGYEAAAANSGEEGIKKSLEYKPDLILLDILMPVMDGFAVLGKLRANAETAHVPVIMLTCKGDSKYIFKSQDYGAVDYLVKQSDPKELLDMVRRYIS